MSVCLDTSITQGSESASVVGVERRPFDALVVDEAGSHNIREYFHGGDGPAARPTLSPCGVPPRQ